MSAEPGRSGSTLVSRATPLGVITPGEASAWERATIWALVAVVLAGLAARTATRHDVG